MAVKSPAPAPPAVPSPPTPEPQRAVLSAEEARLRMEEFATRRKEKMIAAVRKDKN